MKADPGSPLLCRLFGHKLAGDPYSLASTYFARCARKGCTWTHSDPDGYQDARRAFNGRDRWGEPYDWLPGRKR